MKAKQITEHIRQWLVEYGNKSGTDGFVIGISGGIDSALTSTLCASTGKKIFCLNMPIHQHQAEYDRAQEHINWLREKYDRVQAAEVNLTDAFETLQASFSAEVRADKLSMANTRARLRMSALYAFAGHYRLLVAGTGNKVEDFGIGFFTKYGDGGVDISPIADLMKSEVYELAKYLELPQSVQSAKPTDGLFADSRSDEDQIGASYDELEWAMKLFEKNTAATGETEREKQVMRIFNERNTANKHKMMPVPVCIIPTDLK